VGTWPNFARRRVIGENRGCTVPIWRCPVAAPRANHKCGADHANPVEDLARD
jgi:hypothetical protein